MPSWAPWLLRPQKMLWKIVEIGITRGLRWKDTKLTRKIDDRYIGDVGANHTMLSWTLHKDDDESFNAQLLASTIEPILLSHHTTLEELPEIYIYKRVSHNASHRSSVLTHEIITQPIDPHFESTQEIDNNSGTSNLINDTMMLWLANLCYQCKRIGIQYNFNNFDMDLARTEGVQGRK